MRLDKLTDLEIGKKYIDIDKDTYTVAYIGKKRFFYYDQLGEECIGDEKDISRYELRPYEENKERWYEVLVVQTNITEQWEQATTLYTQDKNCGTSLREWDSKEDMINDLKKV